MQSNNEERVKVFSPYTLYVGMTSLMMDKKGNQNVARPCKRLHYSERLKNASWKCTLRYKYKSIQGIR